MKKKLLSIILVLSLLCTNISFVAMAKDEENGATGLYTEAQFTFVKGKVAAKEEPWYSAYNKMIALADEWIAEEPSAVENWYVPGYYGDAEGHKNARQILMNDAKSAYACAMAYKFTGLEKYAKQTVRILDDWTKLKTLGYEDSGLVFSYVGNSLIMSADLVKGYSGWTNKVAFDTWVNDYYLTLANKSWSTGNSGDWNLLARSVGYAYLGDMESLKSIIVGDEDQSGSVKYLIARIREDGILHKELERGSNGLWYSYFALAPLTACCQVLYNNLGEDYFNWESSEGRSIKKAVETYFYYCNHIDEWNQAYKDYYDGEKTTSATYPSPLSSTSWPLPLFEAMAGVYNNQDYCDYVGRYRPVYGTINDGVYHHFAWFFPTLMYGSLQLGGGLPEYVNPDADNNTDAKSDFEKTEYYQAFEDNYTVVNSTTPNGRDKYSVMDGEKELYYIEKSSGAYTDVPVSFPDDGVYGGKSVNATMSNNAKVVVNLPRTYNADDGMVSLEMRFYRPSDNTTINFYENPITEAYNIPSDNAKAAYIFNVKYARFFFNATKDINIAKLPSGADYNNYSSGTWTWVKMDFDFNNSTVKSYYKDARNDKAWQPWGTDNNTFALSGDSLGSVVFEGKGNARVDDIKITCQPAYLEYNNGQITGVIKDEALIGKNYQLQSAKSVSFADYTVESEGVCLADTITFAPGVSNSYLRLVIDGKATAPVGKINSIFADMFEVNRYNGSSNTDWSVSSLSDINKSMYASSRITNTSAKVEDVMAVLAFYGEDDMLLDVRSVTTTIDPYTYKVVSTPIVDKPADVEYVKVIVIKSSDIRPLGVNATINKW